MFSWVLLIVLLLAFTAVGIWFWGAVFGRGEVLPPLERGRTRENNRQAVGSGDVGAIRFDLVHRGYRPEQVDDVIDHLVWRLNEAEETIARLSLPKKD